MDDATISKLAGDFAGGDPADLFVKTARIVLGGEDVSKQYSDMPDGGLVISGMGAVYNNEDWDRDIFAKGAFSESIEWIKKNKDGKVGMYFNHNFYGALPIGVWAEVNETDGGVKVSGWIDPNGGGGNHADGAGVIRAIKNGAIKDLSVTGRIIEREFRADGTRLISKASLREISVVWWGANSSARLKVNESAEKSEDVKNSSAIDIAKNLNYNARQVLGLSN